MARSTTLRLSDALIRRMVNFMARNCCGYIIRYMGTEIGLDFIYRRDDGCYMGVYSENGVSHVIALRSTTGRYIRRNDAMPTTYPAMQAECYEVAYRHALVGVPAAVMVCHHPKGPNYFDGRLLRLAQ